MANSVPVMDRDLWLTSSNAALGSVLATQADVDDVLRAAAEAPRAGRRARARAERRLRKAVMHGDAVVAGPAVTTTATSTPAGDGLAAAGRASRPQA